MGKQRRKFETGFKQQIIQEVESGQFSVSAASRKYQISGSVIDRWRQQARQGGLETAPSVLAHLAAGGAVWLDIVRNSCFE